MGKFGYQALHTCDEEDGNVRIFASVGKAEFIYFWSYVCLFLMMARR